eukprot:scaffold7028_cov28-Tisochrysis_lutea.AAC.4
MGIIRAASKTQQRALAPEVCRAQQPPAIQGINLLESLAAMKKADDRDPEPALEKSHAMPSQDPTQKTVTARCAARAQ